MDTEFALLRAYFDCALFEFACNGTLTPTKYRLRNALLCAYKCTVAEITLFARRHAFYCIMYVLSYFNIAYLEFLLRIAIEIISIYFPSTYKTRFVRVSTRYATHSRDSMCVLAHNARALPGEITLALTT